MEWKKELQKAVQEKKIVIGLKETLSLLRSSKGSFVVIVPSCPQKEDIERYAEIAKIPVYVFDGEGMDLGANVKKPFSVSAVLVK
jgi:large subunit ribosomal protein L30e